mmetsp:Transcript_3392/g.15161  ORF Transcript_3392/g.15161 Transcript_3392/m.15161 type:complete len:234 (+) Transcript_3392:805-1506(+)
MSSTDHRRTTKTKTTTINLSLAARASRFYDKLKGKSQSFDRCSVDRGGSTLYGFSIPRGSNTSLTRRIASIDASSLLCANSRGFMAPMPCSALMLPRRSAVHSYTKGSRIASSAGWYPSGEDTFRCRLPSPRCPYPSTDTFETSNDVDADVDADVEAASLLRVSTTRSYIRSVGSDTSYLYTAPACFSATEMRSRRFHSADACLASSPTTPSITTPRFVSDRTHARTRRLATR